MNAQSLDAVVAAMAATLAVPGPLGEALDRITSAAVDNVPGVDYASISVRHPDDTLTSAASTSPLIHTADALQYLLREGPCYDAVTDDDVTYSPDLSHDSLWPTFGPQVAAIGLLSQMAVRLGERDGIVRALNLYSRARRGIQDEDGLALLFASHAKVALGYATELDTLHGAIGTRETIGKAIGLVMERYELSDERALEFLIRLSQDGNTKLRVIAADIVALRNDENRHPHQP